MAQLLTVELLWIGIEVAFVVWVGAANALQVVAELDIVTREWNLQRVEILKVHPAQASDIIVNLHLKHL